jgi:hypothetical protein
MLLVLASCSRKVHLNKSTKTYAHDSSATTIDTGKTVTHTNTENTVRFGDTLKGSIQIITHSPSEVFDTAGAMPAVEDTIESNGIKVKTSVTKNKNGYRVAFTAIAKPVEVVSKASTEVVEQKAQSIKVDVHTDSTSVIKEKETESESDAWKFYVLLAFLGILSAGVLYLRGKNSGNT